MDQVEVPLLYYFPSADESSSSTQDQAGARAFVYKVREDPRDPARQLVEIVVDGGRELMLADLQVEVVGDRLLIRGDRGPRWDKCTIRTVSYTSVF